MLLIGIVIGAYLTFNVCFAVFCSYDTFHNSWEQYKWWGWPLLIAFGALILLGIIISHYAVLIHEWLDGNWWYYRWLNDTLRYHEFLGMINRMDRRSLTFMAKLNPCNWPRRQLIARANERLKELDQ